jgi:hypothetical protein
MDGSNQSTNFVDSSLNNLTITPHETAQISTEEYKFGGASGFIADGSYISLPQSEAFNFNANDFTIEFWLLQSGENQEFARIFQTSDGDVVSGISISFNATSPVLRCDISFGGETWAHNIIGIGTASKEEWRHFAIARDGETLRFFQNGIQQKTINIGTGGLYYNADDIIIIGGQSDGARSINGYIDELRVIKGYAAYTSNFTPANQPFPNP